ncbi:MAG TPA: DNA polymerase Y family protein [Mucilaginibacter sp.]|jgi:protein ImuB|nr:DNA polymerase Y family protein [Mucilaginibacter sp.]
MPKRYVSIWFRHLLTDWKTIRQPQLKGKAFVFAEPDHGRMVVTAATATAEKYGIIKGMTIADAKINAPNLQVFNDKPQRNIRLLKGLAEWCQRYTPLVAIDPPDGLLLDVTGCTHLKGGELAYLRDVTNRLKNAGYDVRPGLADTIGCAWGVARCATSGLIVPEGTHRNALMMLPPSALRLKSDLLIKLQNLGLNHINSFIHMPKSVLRRRFGNDMVLRLLQAVGQEDEFLLPIKEPVPYSERFNCLEPVKTRPAIEIVIQELIVTLCKRMYSEGNGLRSAIITYYRVDGKNGSIATGTNHPTHNSEHLFKLFLPKLDTITPGMGIELFTLDATKIEPVKVKQNEMWVSKPSIDSDEITELLDRIANKTGTKSIKRHLPSENYWPERCAVPDDDLSHKPTTEWRTDKPRPMQLLDIPEAIEAMALTPDYPPKQFLYKGELHIIISADGPERIEREWWQDSGDHRDYYIVEDEQGRRYWLFRSGHYDAERPQHWFIHGFFA